MRVLFLSIGLLVGATGLAHADRRGGEKQQLALDQKFALPAVVEFPMFELYQWQVLGPRHVVAWSNIHDAYLLSVDAGCNRLEWTNTLNITRAQKWKVSKAFDFVEFGHERCKITQIEPIDMEAMKKDGGSHASSTVRKPAVRS